jgi:hypothetical protein
MKKQLLIYILALFLVPHVKAQGFSFESVQLATILIEQNWKTVESSMGLMSAGLRDNLEKNGATKEAARVFMDDFGKGLNKDSFTKAYAEILNKEMNPQEIAQVYAFVNSPVGKKFYQLFSDDKQGIALLAPVIKSACESSSKKLGFFDRGSLNSLCRNF